MSKTTRLCSSAISSWTPETTSQAVNQVIGAMLGRAWTTILLFVSDGRLSTFSLIPTTFPAGVTEPLSDAVWVRTTLQDQPAFHAAGMERNSASYRGHAKPLGLGIVRIAKMPTVLNGDLPRVLWIMCSVAANPRRQFIREP